MLPYFHHSSIPFLVHASSSTTPSFHLSELHASVCPKFRRFWSTLLGSSQSATPSLHPSEFHISIIPTLRIPSIVRSLSLCPTPLGPSIFSHPVFPLCSPSFHSSAIPPVRPSVISRFLISTIPLLHPSIIASFLPSINLSICSGQCDV